MPSNITSTGEGVGGVDTPPIPEGGEPPPTVDKHNTIFNTTAKR